jgi:hypothetical protein
LDTIEKVSGKFSHQEKVGALRRKNGGPPSPLTEQKIAIYKKCVLLQIQELLGLIVVSLPFLIKGSPA